MTTKTKTNSDGSAKYLNWPRSNKSTDKEWLKGRNKNLTGYCSNYPEGGVERHEGTKPKNWRGRPLPVCTFWQTCPCKCHQDFDEMFESIGMERRLMRNTDYEAEVDGFVLPDMEELTADSVAVTDVGIDTGVVAQDPATVPAAGHARPPSVPSAPPSRLTQRRTDMNQTPRGGLEAMVWEACSQLSADGSVTPRMTSDWIVEKYKIPTPSSGAINAVWDRWEKMGFAEQAKKPNRFVKFLGKGTWEELVGIKARAKSDKRRVRGEQARRMPPLRGR